jgi:hypothetical protein
MEDRPRSAADTLPAAAGAAPAACGFSNVLSRRVSLSCGVGGGLT